jgi:K+-transporting ATPase ATPase C chain
VGENEKENGMKEITSELRAAVVALLLFTFITGVVYPLAVTGVAQVVFPGQANGSLIEQDGRVAGSKLIGQPFDDPAYFWGRLSATGTFAYNAFNADNLTASSGSNYGPLNPALFEMVQARVDALRAADPGNSDPIPVDLVTASASGLDPHISPAAAYYQVGRVAAARGMSEEAVRQLVDDHIQNRQFGILGEPVVNVLELNLALDQLSS